jgi:hypothetical protein
MKKVLLFLSLNLLLNLSLHAQVEFSVGTGVSGLRNFSPQQKFWAFGQTVQANFHFSPKQSAYAWLDYYTEGKFKNNFTAVTKIPFTSPLLIPFTATGRLTYRHFSLGWKHYFRGSYNAGKDFNMYGVAGFGFLFARIRNSFSPSADTSLYHIPVREGESRIRRLTFDLGLGAEMPVGGNFFAFAEARTWLPASSNGSHYLHSQRDVPLPLMVSAGMRVLFGLSY